MKKKRLLKELNLSSYVAIDFETTGLDPNHDRIIEVAAILFKDGEPKKTFSTLVNPGQNIPSFITSITGISNSMVSQSPRESEIINNLIKIIGSHPVVAHNVKFDWSFIESLCKYFLWFCPYISEIKMLIISFKILINNKFKIEVLRKKLKKLKIKILIQNSI